MHNPTGKRLLKTKRLANGRVHKLNRDLQSLKLSVARLQFSFGVLASVVAIGLGGIDFF